MIKKKKKKKHSSDGLSSFCSSFKEESYLASHDQPFTKHSIHSWFDISSTTNEPLRSLTDQTSNLWGKKEDSSNISYSRSFVFLPTEEQKRTLQTWFQDTTHVYNQTLRLLKSKMYYKTSEKPSFIGIRNEMKGVVKGEGRKKRDKLTDSNIPVHVLDCSIKHAVEMYKSALENWRQKHVRRFRIRYQPYHKRSNKILHVEPSLFNKDGMMSRIGLCRVRDSETKKEFTLKKQDIQREVKIQWNAFDRTYKIHLAFERPISKEPKEKEEFISLDPGVSPFLSGVSKSNAFFVAKDSYSHIKEQMKKIDICSEAKISNKKKRKHNERVRRKIKYQIDEMHWKTIHWITSNFHNVLIGDMSAKRVVEGDGIQKMSKRILHTQRLFQFKQRLQFKCKERNVNYFEVNEYLTSKTCSCCGYVKSDLGLNKEYQCTNCHTNMHRDLNGARCIYTVWRMNCM